MFVSIDPATGEELARYDSHDADELERRLTAGFACWQSWQRTKLDDRAALLRSVADGLEKQRDELAALMVHEMGKPVAQAESEVDKCAWVCRHYADEGERYLHPEPIGTDAATSYVRFDPLGPLLAIMPWNYPLWQVFRAAAPAAVAGNTVLLKHAPNVTGCALAIEKVWLEAGAPEGLLQVLLIDDERTDAILADRRVRAVTLTGSVEAGRIVASEAGRALKKHVLELGGSDAFIVLADADVERAASVAAQSRLLNNGQSCISAKRFIILEQVYDEFVERFVEEVRSATLGDPMDRATQVGPLARQDLRDGLADQVRRSVSAGARTLTGGDVPDRPGWFHRPTVLADLSSEVAAWAEETFGPVAAVRRVRSVDEAIAMANDSDFGLGASLWTRDRERAQQLASRVEAGCVMVNQLVKSDPRVPFGGIKDSGYGRELGEYGIQEFVNVKTVWIE
jgi:succinate-semialdehyde dehydrogenase/glutarate-semialdehyde dehydrogenase